ncbi:acyltransferase [Pedobacter nyackensis]|uniref:acyltransferase family protein n=1 Tax=Pedobacter nyackensis TaxID=475255 RepID=UPI00292F515B|nr:acyltransferase [Pedobacter nyackensis]
MHTHELNPEILKTKHHFEILDGLRGVAAIAIVVFHFMEIVYLPDKNFIAHGFLAVDFFFCLSGFVIAYAYDDRIGKMGIKEFFKSRLIRLHPLVIIGTVLGLLAFLFNPFAGIPEGYTAGKIALIFLATLLMIPNPVMADRYFNVFGLNAPAWSLFWEYIANIIYALVLYRLKRNVLLVLAAIAAITLCYVSHRAGGSLLGGWAGENFWDGGARIAYSFLAGMLIFRFNWIIKNKLGFFGLSVLLLLAFLLPHSEWNWLTQLVVVLVYFPMLVAIGAGANLSQHLKAICVFLGKLSYPLYMTHYAVMWIFASYYTTYKPSFTLLVTIIIGGTALLIGFAYLVMKFYDSPVRAYLTSKRKKVSN